VPPVGFGMITSWKDRNRVGIDIVIPPPDDEPPELPEKLVIPGVAAVPVFVAPIMLGVDAGELITTGIGLGMAGVGLDMRRKDVPMKVKSRRS
jgi:hypothetical protein